MKKLVLILLISLIGCGKVESLKLHQDAIIHSKHHTMGNGYSFHVELDTKLYHIRTTKYEYSKYSVGDTIDNR